MNLAPAAISNPSRFAWNGRLVAIGASAGGVEALAAVMENFPAQCPPTVIVQHIPAHFVGRFAQRLNRLSAPEIGEAYEGARLAAGTVTIAGGDRHLEISADDEGWFCRFGHEPPVNGFKPSIDVLFSSVARIARSRAVGVIMSGMGRDGVKGLMEMRAAGARTLGQDAATSVVYGMPKAAFEAGAVERQCKLENLANGILDLCNSYVMETLS